MSVCNTAKYKRLQRFFVPSMQLYSPRHKTAHRASQRLFLRLHPLNRPRYQHDTSGYNAACATLGAAQVSTTVYYNKVYKRADHASPAGSAPTVCRSLASAAPGVPAEGSAPPPVQGQPGGLRSGTGSACRPPPGRAVQQQGRGGRRGTIDGYRRISFRAFAR